MFSIEVPIFEGDEISAELDFGDLRFAKSLGVYVDVDGADVVVEVSPTKSGDEWFVLQEDGEDVKVGAGEGIVISYPAFMRVRLATEVEAEDDIYCWIVVRD